MPSRLLTSLRPHLLAVILLGLVTWLLHATVRSIEEGRDAHTYFLYYRDILRIYPELPLCQLFRTPGTPLFFGLLYDFTGPAGVALTLWIAYAAALALVFVVGASLHLYCGYAAWLFVALDLSYYEWFNRVASESPQSILLMVWTAFAFFTFHSSRLRTWACHAGLIFLLVMIRPGNQVAGLALLIPLLNTATPWRMRLKLAGSATAVYLALVAGYCTYNYARYGDFVVARLGDAHLPFYRTYVQDPLIRPANGPASAQLARIFDETIATNPTMMAYGIDQATFFTTPTPRMFSALILAINERHGWKQHYPILRQAGIEAALAHPLQFWLGYLDHVRAVFACPGPGSFRLRPSSTIDGPPLEDVRKQRYARYQTQGLPIPSEEELVPSTIDSLLNAKPQGYPDSTATLLGIHHKATPWDMRNTRLCVPDVTALDRPYERLRAFPLPCIAAFLLLGIGATLFALFSSSTLDIRLPVLCLIQMINLLVTLMASVQAPFRCPFDPLFILFGCTTAASLLITRTTPKSGIANAPIS